MEHVEAGATGRLRSGLLLGVRLKRLETFTEFVDFAHDWSQVILEMLLKLSHRFLLADFLLFNQILKARLQQRIEKAFCGAGSHGDARTREKTILVLQFFS